VFRSFLSWRYLRRRRTNLIGIVGLFVAVGALILILSIMSGFLEESRRTLRGSLSDIVITSVQPSTAAPADVPRAPGALLAAVRADERVQAAAPHLVWYAVVAREGEDSRILGSSQYGTFAGAILVGVDLPEEFEATDFDQMLAREPGVGSRVADPEHPFAPPPGYDPSVGRPRPSVVDGEQLFQNHRLHRGAFLQLGTMVQQPDSGEWEFSSREFVVAGTFLSRDNEFDLQRIYLQREDLAKFLSGVPADEPLAHDALQYNEVLVLVRDYAREGQALAAELEQRLVAEGLLPLHSDVKTWEDFRGTLLGAIENERVLMGIMLSLVMLVAGFTIFAILSMMVSEKRRDIGILTALGATPRGVLSLFLMIGFWDALLGATLGAAAGCWAAVKIDTIERWLSRTFGYEIFDRRVYLFNHIPSVVDPVLVAAIVLGAFVCALLFAAIPAWKAASLDPLDALRYE